MTDIIYKTPVVRGSCDPFGACGGNCCRMKVYRPGNKEYDLEWCQHFDEHTRKCKIYETRPNGCRTYPEVDTFLREEWLIPGCGYYLDEKE